jgi:pyruvate dehydrogenase E1 component alpha subunit
VEEWKKRDPIPGFQERLFDWELLSPEDVERIEAGVTSEIDEAVRFADESEWEPAADVAKDVMTDAAG